MFCVKSLWGIKVDGRFFPYVNDLKLKHVFLNNFVKFSSYESSQGKLLMVCFDKVNKVDSK